MKRAGYFGEGERILIPNFGDKTQRTIVSEDYITITRTLRSKSDYKRWERVTEKVYLHSGSQLLIQLQKRFKKPLPPGEYWSLKVGDNNTFINARYKTLHELMAYASPLADKWMEQGEDSSGQWAAHHVHLVKFRFESGHEIEHGAPIYNPHNPADFSNYRKPKWKNKRGK